MEFLFRGRRCCFLLPSFLVLTHLLTIISQATLSQMSTHHSSYRHPPTHTSILVSPTESYHCPLIFTPPSFHRCKIQAFSSTSVFGRLLLLFFFLALSLARCPPSPLWFLISDWLILDWLRKTRDHTSVLQLAVDKLTRPWLSHSSFLWDDVWNEMSRWAIVAIVCCTRRQLCQHYRDFYW